MKRSFIFLLLPLFAATTAQAQETVTIKGNTSGDTKGYNKIYVYGTNIKSDSAVLENGTFTLTIPYKPGIAPTFYTEYEAKTYHRVSPFSAIIDGPCTLYLKDVEIDKGMSSGTWSGNKCAEDYQSYSRQSSDLSKEIAAMLKEKYPDGNFRDAVYRKSSDSLYAIHLTGLTKTFVKAHPDSYASAVILRGNRARIDQKALSDIYNMLSAKQKNTTVGKDVAAYIMGVKSAVVGKPVKDFTLLTPSEQSFTFSSLKGKYVLIDFWASWCGPCKASFPHMKEVYKKFKGDKFEIYSISIDKEKEAWLKELKKQALPWLQTLDTKNISQSGFAVTAVPTTFLIDPDGKILMIEQGFDSNGNGALEKKLNKLFAKQ